MSLTLVIAVGALFIGLSKGGFGGPVLVAMLTPLISLALPAGQAVGIVLPLLIFGDVFAVWIYWRKWDSRYMKLLLPSGILGIIVGGLLLVSLANSHQDILLRRIVGLLTIVLVLYKVASERLKSLQYEPRNWHGHLAGLVSGVGSALANIGSPSFTAYMLFQKVDPVAFLGTSSLFFAILNVLKLPLTLVSSNVLDLHLFLSIAWVLPLIPIGVWLGRRMINWIDARTFDNMMLVLLFLMGLILLFAS